MRRHFSDLALSIEKCTTNELVFWSLSLLMVARLTVMVRQRAAEDSLVVDGAAGFQVGLVLLTVIAVTFRSKWSLLIKSFGCRSILWFLAFYCLCAVSAIWSIQPHYTLYRAIEYLSQTIAIMSAFLCLKSLRAAEIRFFYVSFIVIALQLIGTLKLNGWRIFSLPEYHNVTYGLSAGILACYAFGEAIGARRVDRNRLLIIGFVSFALTMLSTSSSSIIGTLAAVFVVSLFSRRPYLAVLVISIVLISVMLPAGTLRTVLFHNKDEQMISSMSGRKSMWEGFISLIQERPITGYGMSIAARFYASSYNVNSHNSWLATLLSAGILGATCMVCCWFAAMVESFSNWVRRRPGSMGCLGGLIMVAVNSNTFAFFGEDWCSPSHTLVCLFCVHAMFVSNYPTS